jgi:hypothetical protein
MSVPPIVVELIENLRTSISHPKRLRIAVDPAEYETVRTYMLNKYGEFYGRILNVPIVVDPLPKDPPLLAEFKE